MVIHGIPKKIAAQIQITTPPSVRENTALKPCQPVQAIEQARAKAAELGGKVGPKSKEWEAHGCRAAT